MAGAAGLRTKDLKQYTTIIIMQIIQTLSAQLLFLLLLLIAYWGFNCSEQ